MGCDDTPRALPGVTARNYSSSAMTTRFVGKDTTVNEGITKPDSASIDEFIAEIESSGRRADTLAVLKIFKEVTGFPPVIWGASIIGFGIHHYTYDSGRQGTVPAAGFSPRKPSMTFYVSDKFEGAETLYARLGKHEKSVACLYIDKLDDVDLQVLREIIARDYAETLSTAS